MQSLALAFRHGVSVRASHSLSVHLQSPVRLAASVMIASMALGASAQQADSLPPAAGQLDDVVVSANRAPRKADAVVADVSVLTRADLARLDGLTLTQALARLPGIQFTSNGGRGKSSSLFVRGNESTQTVLIVDGVRLGSATLGQPSLDNLPIDQIERIEVVRGNMSALYGPDAMGGVINVITKRSYRGGEVRLSYENTFDTDTAVQNIALNLANAEDAGCAVGIVQNFGVAGSATGASLCADTLWELNAVATDNTTQTQYTATSGVAVRTLAAAVMPASAAAPVAMLPPTTSTWG